MVEPAAKSSEWSTWAALRSVGWLLLVGALIAGWFWATNGVDLQSRNYPLLDVVWGSAMLFYIVVGVPMAYLWIMGRRRAEDEADRAGRSIKDAQDEYDARPRPLAFLVMRLPFAVTGFTLMPKVFELADQQLWLRAAVAGLIMSVALGAFLLQGYLYLSSWRARAA